MAAFAAALPYISAAVSVGSIIGQANTQSQMANIEADQLERQSMADTAEAVQSAKQERKRAEMLKSRVVALSAKSGSSGMDIENAISDIDQQGEYNALAALYSGTTASNSKKYAATAARASGASSKAGGKMAAAGTILSTMDKLYG